MITPAEPISTAASARSTAFVMAHATRTEAEYWLGLQVAFELFQAKKKLASELNALPALVYCQQPRRTP